MNITILCGSPTSPYARDVMRALNACGLHHVNVVAVTGGNTPRAWRDVWARYRWRLPISATRAIALRLKQRLSAIRLLRSPSVPDADALRVAVQVQGGRLIGVQEANSHECQQALRALRVDLMILAGAPIVRSCILQVPRLGTLNAHQGLLPRFRGMNVIEWAILEGYPPTITVHFVDAGVDTGDIIMAEPIPLLPGDTLATVRKRASERQPVLLAQTAKAAIAGALPRCPQRSEDGRQYFIMHPILRTMAEQRLQTYLQTLAVPIAIHEPGTHSIVVDHQS